MRLHLVETLGEARPEEALMALAYEVPHVDANLVPSATVSRMVERKNLAKVVDNDDRYLLCVNLHMKLTEEEGFHERCLS